MKRISSKSTAYYKRVFPTFWFGFIALFVIVALTQGAARESPMFLVVPCVMAVFGYFLMKRLLWDLVDEVYDCGDSLLIRNRGQEHHIAFSDIMNVNSSLATNPPRITLRLAVSRDSKALGAEVAFSPEKQFTLNPFARNAVAEDLIVRVDRARAKRAVQPGVSADG